MLRDASNAGGTHPSGPSAPHVEWDAIQLPPLDQQTDRWPGRSLRLAGVELFVRRCPCSTDGGEPALLIHGLGGASTNWTDFGALLAGYSARPLDVEAIDLPGFGNSGQALNGDYSIALQAATVIAYLDHRRHETDDAARRVHLVGNSMGALIAAEVAARRPDLVRTLTLISPAVPDLKLLRVHPLRANPLLATLVLPGLGTLAVRYAARLPAGARVRGTLITCFADPSRYPAHRFEQELAEVEARRAVRWGSSALLKATRALIRVQFFQRRATWKRMRSITAPTLVVWGDVDRLVAPDLAHRVAEAIPNSTVVVFNDIGHVAMMEDPVATARAFIQFLNASDVLGASGR